MSDKVLAKCPSLPISGRRGSEKLRRLRRRADWLNARIQSQKAAGAKTLFWDESELNALNWVIDHVIQLETDLKAREEQLGVFSQISS